MCRKMTGILLICSILFTLFSGIGGVGTTVSAATFGTGVVVQAESGVLGNDMQKLESPSADGKHCISVLGGNTVTDPQNLPVPDATYTFNITTAGSYKVYLRCYAPNTSSNSFYYRWDNAVSYTSKTVTSSNSWTWTETSAQYLATGTHQLDITHRVSKFYVDLIVVATNITSGQTNQIEANILAGLDSGNTSTAADFFTADGSVVFEAEQATLNASLFGITTDAAAAGGNAITALVNQASAPSQSVAGAEFNITPDRSTAYDVWIRYSASSSQNSVYLSVNGEPYVAKTLNATGTNPSAYGWMKLASTSSTLFEGSRYTFKLHPAKAGLRIDKIVVTTYQFFNPSGDVTGFSDLFTHYALPSNAYPLPSITPPPEHPRLGFRESDIPTIKANMTKPGNAGALQRYNTYLSTTVDGKLPPVVVPDSSNYNSTILATIESYALKYALDKDATYGNKAIATMKDYLDTLHISSSLQDPFRNIGHTIYIASVVYDWCYPLLSDADKNFFIVACEGLSTRMSIGYPPSKMGAVTGHAGEPQVFRDQISFAIATYNERPDIYNYVAGRVLSHFIEPRDYWFASHTHNQGDSYGHFRHIWEIYFQWLMYRMSGQEVLGPQMEYVPYQWIYTRRPDGQQFRNGDSGNNKSAVIGTYWTGDVHATMLSSSFYKNPYVKNLHTAANPTQSAFSTDSGYMTPSTYLIFNDPDLQGVSHTSTFPLTKYFGSPYGMMIARTGWTEPGQANVNLNSNIAMAQMQIGEQWAANHQHLDVGSFQLYYKGPLAIDSGVYDTYGGSHDNNYHKETIAHNTLLIYDPNESVYGGAVNSGGQRRAGGEVSTFQAWMNSGYDMAKVLDHDYDKTGSLPKYSYIKGDITRAYSGKVSEVLRSMLFMPLEDQNHPAAFVVMDKITSTNPTFKKTWLLHSQQEPEILDNTAVVKRNTNGYNGRMDLVTLLPENPTLSKLGGPGQEFSINGINYPPTSYGNNGCEYGAWRIEASPSYANATDYFLNVMQVSDASANLQPLATQLIQTNALAGVKLSNRVALFGKGKSRLKGPLTFNVPGSESGGLKILLAGMEEGTWNIYRNASFAGSANATADGGTVSFEGGAGEYSLLHTGENTDALLMSLSYGYSGNILGSGEFDYTISLPGGSTTAPIVSATPIHSGASVVITQADGVPGTATVVVTAPSGQNSNTYTIHFTRADLGDATIAGLSYTINGVTKSVPIDGAINRFKTYLPYGSGIPTVSVTPTYAQATVDIVQPSTFPGEAKITVTAANGSQVKKYYLRFTYPKGNITNLKNNLSTRTYLSFSDLQPQSLSELRELFGDVGNAWEQYSRCFMDRGFTAVSETQGGSNIPADPALAQVPAGQNWFYMWIAKGTTNGNTTQIFNGASWIATSNSDFRPETLSPYLTTTNGDAITFDIDRPAKVWVAFKTSTAYTNYTDKGWTRVPSTEGYKVVHGDAGLYSNFYTKDFEAGRVEIPCIGSASLPDRAFIPLVVWKDNRVDPIVTWPEINPIAYGETFAAAISGGEGDGSFTMEDAELVPSASETVYNKVLTFTPNDILNFNSLTRTVSVVVNKADPNVNWPDAEELTGYVGGRLRDLDIGQGFSWAEPDALLSKPGGTYTLIYTPQEPDNYNTLTKEVFVQVLEQAPYFILSPDTVLFSDPFAVKLTLSHVKGLKGIQGRINYNKDVFELYEITPPGDDGFKDLWLVNIQNESGYVNFLGGRVEAYSEEETAQPTIMTLHFRIKSSAEPGVHPITISSQKATTSWGQEVLLGQPQNTSMTISASNIAYGDINGDGAINIFDVIIAAEIAVGDTDYTPTQIARANVSSKTDAAVDISDVVLILERVSGRLAPFPVELL